MSKPSHYLAAAHDDPPSRSFPHKPPLGGGPPTITAAAQAVFRAEVPPKVATAVATELSSHLPVAGFPWSVFTAVSEQNSYLSSSRSCRSFMLEIDAL
jgi:hypothetical protein